MCANMFYPLTRVWIHLLAPDSLVSSPPFPLWIYVYTSVSLLWSSDTDSPPAYILLKITLHPAIISHTISPCSKLSVSLCLLSSCAQPTFSFCQWRRWLSWQQKGTEGKGLKQRRGRKKIYVSVTCKNRRLSHIFLSTHL